jgi:hypothetical protein
MKNLLFKNPGLHSRVQESREAAFALKIRQSLQKSSEQLQGDVTARLKVARDQALDRQKQSQEVLIVAHRPAYLRSDLEAEPSHPWWKQGLVWVLPALVLTFAMAGANEWQQAQHIDELAEIDALILADDLPLDAHLDPGFATTLHTSE